MISSRLLSKVILEKLKEEDPLEFFHSTITYLEKNHLMYLLPNIVRHMESDLKKTKVDGTISIVTSHEQESSVIEKIKSKVSSWDGSEYKVSVDSGLLSGVVVRGKNRILDASLRTNLKQLKALLTK
jgi:F0F1-type ATP synthase delta subunit